MLMSQLDLISLWQPYLPFSTSFTFAFEHVLLQAIINMSKVSLWYIWQDVYFDDESAEVVISSLRLGDDQERQALILPLWCSIGIWIFGRGASMFILAQCWFLFVIICCLFLAYSPAFMYRPTYWCRYLPSIGLR